MTFLGAAKSKIRAATSRSKPAWRSVRFNGAVALFAAYEKGDGGADADSPVGCHRSHPCAIASLRATGYFHMQTHYSSRAVETCPPLLVLLFRQPIGKEQLYTVGTWNNRISARYPTQIEPAPNGRTEQ